MAALNELIMTKCNPNLKLHVLTRTWLSCLALSGALIARGDQTFLWSGDDQRFNGSFSISDNDFERRSFQTITAARFEYNDSKNPGVSVILDNPSGFYPGNTDGTITADGTRLKQNSWVAVWQPETGIEVGMYGHFDGAGGGLFTYANYLDNFVADSRGTWVLEVPEPSITILFVSGMLILFYGQFVERFYGRLASKACTGKNTVAVESTSV
jgi:hypothetical protein